VVPWYSRWYFKDLGEAWRVVYRVEGRPAAVARDFGRGKVLLLADSYLFSNEAVKDAPQAAWLSWLTDGGRPGPLTVVFDEAHLGSQANPGVAVLARRYGLGPLAAVLLVLAGLFIWQRAFSLAPPPADDQAEALIDRDAEAGLIGLLTRHVGEKQAVGLCLDQWAESFSESENIIKTAREHAEAARREGGPPAAYQAAAMTLAQGKPWKKKRNS
jgi:hypothetical protein